MSPDSANAQQSLHACRNHRMQQTTTAAATAAIALHTEHSNNINSRIVSRYTSIDNTKLQQQVVVQDGETGLALSSLRAACTNLPLFVLVGTRLLVCGALPAAKWLLRMCEG
jgi:hypothetical protein